MRMPAEPRRRRSLLWPSIVILAALGCLVGLGLWQIERKAWKESLIATLEQRLAQPPVPLPGAEIWPSLDRTTWEFRRVRFAAELQHAQEALVYTAGSPLRTDVSGPGYWVFTPARPSGGGAVAVNRGFVPQDRRDPQARTQGRVPGTVELTGVLRWPEERSWFLAADDPARNLFFARDPQAMADAKQWGAVAQFYVDLETPIPPGGLPRPGPLAVNLRNQHLQYALTWFALAVALVVVSAFWLRRRMGEPSSGRPDPFL